MGLPTFKICPPGMPMYLPLSVLVLQTAVPLLIRLSRKYRPAGSGSSYLPASITLLAEAIKCLVAFAFMARARGRRMRGHRRSALPWGEVMLATAKRFREAVIELSSLMLPAMLYFASNVTAVYALSHVRSYMFTAIMNARIVFAALLSLAVLDKHVSTEQWRAILIIFCAATVLCLEDVQVKEDFTVSEETVGVFISLGTAAVSAAGGVFMEKYLLSAALQPRGQAADGCGDTGGPSSDSDGSAGSGSDVWEQQCVLALFSAAFATLYVAIFHLPALLHGDLLRGWTIITVTIVAMQATQGVLVAFTIARCGIVFRLILGTLSICLCILIEGLAFREPVLAREVLTIAMVIIGSNLYATSSTPTMTSAGSSSKAPSVITVAEEESLPIITTDDAWPGNNSKALQGDKAAKSSSSDGWSHSLMGGTPSKELAYPAPLRALAGLHKAGSGSGATGGAQGSMLRRVSLLLVVTIVYISFSSSFSVILASRTRKVDDAQAAFLQPAVLALSDMSEVERKAQALRLRQQERQASEGATAGGGSGSGSGKGAVEGTALLGGDEVDDVDLRNPPTKADKADADRLRASALSEVLQSMAESDSSVLKAAAVALRYQQGETKCRVEDYFEERPWDPQAPMLAAKGGRGGGRRDVAVCVQIKNDAAVLDEYIAFHWVQGVGRFVIYDDDSIDDPWSVLKKYVALGVVEYHDVKGHAGSGGNELQTENYNRCFASIREHAHESGLRWILFPDIDEFFLPHDSTSTLSQTLNKHFDHSPCIEVARTYFGSSFQHRRPTGLVVENYVLASPVGADGFPKMVANVHPTGASRNATALFTVHNIVDQADIPCTWMGESNQHIRIHHYVRSLQDYETKVLTGHKALNRYTKPLELWWERDRNERLDTTAADYGCRVRAAMAQLDSIKASLPEVERPPSPYSSALLTGQATTHGEEIMIGVQ